MKTHLTVQHQVHSLTGKAPRSIAVQRESIGSQISAHSEWLAILLASLFCVGLVALFSVIQVIDYTAGSWHLFG